MKIGFWAFNTYLLLLAVLGGCAATRRPPEPAKADVRGAADDLRVDHEYRPAPTGAEVLAVSYDHPPRDYYVLYRDKGYYNGYYGGTRGYRPCDRPRWR